jgi:hypothetical protein
MPTIDDLRQARALIDAQRREGIVYEHEHGRVDSSSEDEGFGPQLCDARTARVLQASASAQPLGFAGADIDPAFERAFAYDIHGKPPRCSLSSPTLQFWRAFQAGTQLDHVALYCAGIHPSGDRYTGEKHQVAEENKREEWILTPGDSSIAACTSRLLSHSHFLLAPHHPEFMHR